MRKLRPRVTSAGCTGVIAWQTVLPSMADATVNASNH